MTLQIGRLTGLPEPSSFNLQGGTGFDLHGWYQGASVAAAQVMREQLLGYSDNPDEPVIPILSTADTRLNGFYRVTDVVVPVTTAFEAKGLLEYTIKGMQTSARQSASHEAILSGALMANDHGINAATAEPGHGFPDDGNLTGYFQNPLANAFYARTADSGALWWYYMNGIYKNLARFAVRPAFFYNGACEIGDISSPAHTLVGTRESPAWNAWQIRNGLVRIEQGSTSLVFKTTWYDGTGWRTVLTDWGLFGFSSGQIRAASTQAPTIRVIRNSPEEVVIRYAAFTGGGFAWGPVALDIRLRRGYRVAWFYLQMATGLTEAFTATFGPTTASTALTGGIRSTTADGFGNRVVLCTAKTFSSDLVNGNITQGSTRNAFDFGQSLELNGASAAAHETAQSQIYQYLAAQSERMRIVTR